MICTIVSVANLRLRREPTKDCVGLVSHDGLFALERHLFHSYAFVLTRAHYRRFAHFAFTLSSVTSKFIFWGAKETGLRRVFTAPWWCNYTTVVEFLRYRGGVFTVPRWNSVVNLGNDR